MSNYTIFKEPVAGRYRLNRQIGSGNMSTVYEAQDMRRGQRIVAVKLLNTPHDDALKQEIFRRESKALTQLEHPNIVSVLDYGWDIRHRCHYLVFEYLPRTLLDEIRAHLRDRDHEWCWSFMRQMTDALVHAHSQGVIHRDVKPSNVLIDAKGVPKLVDFGISLLKFELATGVTVSSFFSIGYSAPEQRRGEQASEQSDLYSLGCVFYHMLTRKAPPSEGFLTQTQIEEISVFGQIKQILHRMLAIDPGERIAEAAQLRRRLEVTHKLELLPEVYLLMTDRARRDLFDQGYIEEASTEAACAFLLEELGDDTPKAVHMSLDRGGIRITTSTLRLICARDATLPVLVIKAIHVPYLPQMELERSRATSFRYLWQVVGPQEASNLPPVLHTPLGRTLNALITQLGTHQSAERRERKESEERHDLTRVWGNVLSFQQERLEAVPKLAYQNVTQAGDTLHFHLQDPAPDLLGWADAAPVAVIDPDRPQKILFVGHFMSTTGKRLQVSRDTGDTHSTLAPTEHIPSPGFVSLYQREAKVALERQQSALSLIRSGTTVNPRLSSVLLDLSTAEFEAPDTSIEFFQPDLGEDKQRAVQQALAARDVFLLQGPPGTGKTTTLAEIILQILKIKPDARILVASQSNVAVNHILSRLAELRGSDSIETVRIGRAEKIGHGAQVWTIEERLAIWSNEVIKNTDVVLADLKARLKKKHQEAREQQRYTPRILDDLQQCQTWLEELTESIADLAALGEEGQENTDELATTLALIRETLPEDIQGEALPLLSAEWERLTRVVTEALTPGASDSREQALIQLVTNWRKLFGKQRDFARPILDRATILAATCLISGGEYLKDQQFDWAIIDEAGRATAPELLVSLVRARRAIIVGDERQLPPMLDADLSDEDLAGLGTSKEHLTESLFSTLVAQGKDEPIPAVQMLTMQHRMHPAIGQLVSTVFYGGKLTHAVAASDREHRLPWLKRSVAWYSTARLPRHFETQQGPSYYNRTEVQGISQLLHQMERSYRELGEQREVAVITPYNAQIIELQAEIIPTSAFWQALSIEISTIDAFQGRDRDIVLYSTVRSNKTGQLGFLRDRRRLNVALSRARQALLIVGDIRTLEEGRAGPLGNPYLLLIRYLRTHPEDCMITDLTVEVPHE